MTDAWLAEIRAGDSFAQRSSREIQEQRLALALTFPGIPLAIPTEAGAGDSNIGLL